MDILPTETVRELTMQPSGTEMAEPVVTVFRRWTGYAMRVKAESAYCMYFSLAAFLQF
jgi:hypothetical protein